MMQKYWTCTMDGIRTFLYFLVLCHSVSALELTGPSVLAARLGSDALVPCRFTVDKPPVDPKHLTIFWHYRDQHIVSYDKSVMTTSSRYSLSNKALEAGIANLTISNITIPDGGMYKCSVIYSSERKETEVQVNIGAPPQVTITGKTVVMNKKSVLRCSTTGFYPVDIDIRWFRDGEKLEDYVIGDPWRNPDKTYSVNSNVTIIPTKEDRERNFSCRVRHKYLQEALQEDFHLEYGVRPVIVIPTETVRKDRENTLLCVAAGFFPRDIEITWTLDGKILNNSYISEEVKNEDNTYNVTSSVTFPPTPEIRNVSCTVHHASLHEPLQRDLLLIYEEHTTAWIIAVCSVIAVLLIIIIAGFLWWKLKPRRTATGAFTIRDIECRRKMIDGEEATLYCTVDTCPEDLRVAWLIKRDGQVQEIQTSQMRGHTEEEEESLLDTSYVIKSQREGRQYSTSLSFIPHMDRHKDVTFICRAFSSQHNAEKTFHCKTVYGKPRLSQPVMRSLFVSGEMKYLLNLEKFYPKNIKIVWTCGVGGPEEVVSSTESISDNPDRSCNVSSEVRIPEDRHKDPGFRVRVTWNHESMDEPESRELSIRDPDYIWTPVMEEIQIPHLLHGIPAILQCNISEYFPDAVTVKWKRRAGDKLHEETDIADNQKITSRRAANNTYSCTASLPITPTLETHQGVEYICVVEHPSLEKPTEKSTGRLQVRAEPQMLAPIEVTMADSSRVQFSLNLQKFYPKAINISWSIKNPRGKYVLSPTQTLRTNEDNLTYDVFSVVSIPVHPFHDPKLEITVMWKHETMKMPETRTLSIRDLPWRPHVGSINLPKMEDETKATLTCDISGYFPDLLSVSWFTKKDGSRTALPIESVKKDNAYKIAHKKKTQKDNTYSSEASLTFTPLISSDQGSEIICRVEHPGLERPIERSSGLLHIDVKKENMEAESIYENSDIANHWITEKFIYDTEESEDVSEDLKVEEINENTGAEV